MSKIRGQAPASFELVGNTIFARQRVGDDSIVTAFDTLSGESDWVRSFVDAPLIATRDGDFVFRSDDGTVRLGDLSGIRTDRTWDAGDGCTTYGGAENPTGDGYFLELNCPSTPVNIVHLDDDLHEVSRFEVSGSLIGYSNDSTLGPYVVFQSNEGDVAAVIRDERLVYAGADLGSATFALVGDDLAITPSLEGPTLFINRDGGIVVPRDPARFTVGSRIVAGFNAHVYTFYDPRDGAELGKDLSDGGVIGITMLRSGDAAVERTAGSATTIRRIELTRRPPAPNHVALQIIDEGRLSIGSTDYVIDAEATEYPDVVRLEISTRDATGAMEVGVTRLPSEAEAQRAWLTWSSTDPSAFIDEEVVRETTRTYLRQGHCLAYLSPIAGRQDIRPDLEPSIFTSVVTGGCDAN
ncbi:hypothetical protein PYV02_15215 [Leifsonia sp. H3M29-4]|uniref:hypothetical protein n=1 Tax=Salinibacterium metalliresistens TaxID=3031321 RepID=UPI0023DC7242|nr:hypothetical protein [Salinibacterium metalliresistens]MDF1480430.1 hypothetical protein [Salinibacterium metalliresistens]